MPGHNVFLPHSMMQGRGLSQGIGIQPTGLPQSHMPPSHSMEHVLQQPGMPYMRMPPAGFPQQPTDPMQFSQQMQHGAPYQGGYHPGHPRPGANSQNNNNEHPHM